MLTALPDTLDRPLEQTFEEAILCGTVKDLDHALDLITADGSRLAGLRYELESLRYFRAHYSHDNSITHEGDRERITRLDADWTMRLLAQSRLAS